MAPYSSILVWEIPQAKEPGGLQSMGPQRVGHNKVTEHIQILKEGQFIFYLVNLKGKSHYINKIRNYRRQLSPPKSKVKRWKLKNKKLKRVAPWS